MCVENATSIKVRRKVSQAHRQPTGRDLVGFHLHLPSGTGHLECDAYLYVARLIIVPGIGTQPPEEWVDTQGRSWLRSIPEHSAPGCTTYIYDHGRIPSDSFAWHTLLDTSEKFLVDLLELRDSEEVLYALRTCEDVLVK